MSLRVHVGAQAPVTYRISFPEPEHRFAQVEVTFAEVGSAPLEVRMSRSSPGRYALHEFARNVFDVQASDGNGKPLAIDRPDAHQWTVPRHDGTVRMRYRVHGDQVDGTFLAVDATHAHLNMPATLMWARGHEDRPARITFERPAGRNWIVATQLHPTDDPFTYTAANLQYLMDSPVEFSNLTLKTFTVRIPGGAATSASLEANEARIRLALHHNGTDREAQELATDIAKLAREAGAIFGEFPSFDVGHYTVLADYLPYAAGDGMEHRNSTVVSASGALSNAVQRESMLGTIAHEFFHSWNVERIRPRSLEPFNFDQANISGELWLAEGVTSYYQNLLMRRTGLTSLEDTVAEFAHTIDVVTRSPGRSLRSPVDMSRLAPFVDAARWSDRTNWDNLYISYYTWGAALGLGLDLSLRELTRGRVTLDDYMRVLWRAHGRPPARAEGLVAAPYTLRDARLLLGEISGDQAFADQFFDRFIEGREVVDYAALLERAGLVLRKRNPGRAWLGDVRLSFSGASTRIAEPVPVGSPLYRAGLDRDDEILALDGEAISSSSQLEAVLQRHRPGDEVAVIFARRDGRVKGSVTLEEDPRIEIVPAERTGRPLTAAERTFRDAWLTSRHN
ncbi:MAG: M61 family peptidase [Acidobacteria bacterium]|nr:MAG: M61 family peptidase [Acidobacteriota bacterium]